jgi:predicted alpha/beta hydrolase family esterase
MKGETMEIKTNKVTYSDAVIAFTVYHSSGAVAMVGLVEDGAVYIRGVYAVAQCDMARIMTAVLWSVAVA